MGLGFDPWTRARGARLGAYTYNIGSGDSVHTTGNVGWDAAALREQAEALHT